jgi:D-alanine-D-alanine ligase
MTTSHKVALLFGGRSGEHEVSVRSAQAVAHGLRQRHEVLLILVDRTGRWFLQPGPEPSEQGGEAIFIVPNHDERGALRRLSDASVVARPDVWFPVMHGTYGEDGTIQGLLELAGVPYVGSGVAGSAAGMDKDLMKAVFGAAGLPQVPYRVLRQPQDARGALEGLRFPVFVKPANLGSSVGISKVKRQEDLRAALDEAFRYDVKVLIEEGLDVREIEIAVLGNDDPEASVPGEIIPDREFYDYDSKYSSDSKTRLEIPAQLEPAVAQQVRELAVKCFRAIDAAGLSRVDFFVEKTTGRVFLNEINTLPGFTSISMYPKLWEATGVAYADLLERLLALGIERHARRSSLRTDFRA